MIIMIMIITIIKMADWFAPTWMKADEDEFLRHPLLH